MADLHGSVDGWVAGLALLFSALMVGVVAVERQPSTSGATASHLRDVGICGVSVSDDARLTRVDGAPRIEVEDADSRADGGGVVLRFREPTDHVDFVARGVGEAFLVALDREGRIVDVDAGSVSEGPGATMQVTAAEPTIHEAHFFLAAADAGGTASISDLDVGGVDCP